VTTNDPVNILLVDDQPSKLLSYEVVLADLGENLIKASSAREALEQLLRTDIAIVLIDVCMPDLDGFELAMMIREHPRFQQTSLIFVSAIQVTDLDRLRGYECGAVDYVPVPVVPEVLRAKVRVFAELHRKTRALEQLNAELEQRVAERTAALAASTEALQKLNENLEQRVEAGAKEREAALAQLFEAQKIDTIGQLTGGVAHDFNNLLMVMLGSLQLLKKRLPQDPSSRRLLDNAVEAAERGAALTKRLLAFARRQELKPEVLDVADLIAGIQDLLDRALPPGVSIHKDLPPGLAAIRVDANQLELALLNLTVNACDAMSEGGRLTISACNEVISDQRATPVLEPGAYVRISVADTGEGMDETTLARATEPFFTTKGIGKGTGLGLSMVHGLAAQSGGTLSLSSKPGEGTVVELWLPQAGAEAILDTRIQPHATAGAGAASVGARTILLVDDDLLVSTGAVAMLEDLGHMVVTANSGRQALEMLNTSEGVDLVITDHAMPEMTGLELARKIRAVRPELGLILASGYAELPADGCEELGLFRLPKPFRLDELSAAIIHAAGAHSGPPRVPDDGPQAGLKQRRKVKQA